MPFEKYSEGRISNVRKTYIEISAWEIKAGNVPLPQFRRRGNGVGKCNPVSITLHSGSVNFHADELAS